MFIFPAIEEFCLNPAATSARMKSCSKLKNTRLLIVWLVSVFRLRTAAAACVVSGDSDVTNRFRFSAGGVRVLASFWWCRWMCSNARWRATT